ncbi:MAG: hypothetical protein BBJ60_12120 [Desulfobacterales bacterium S7086C20]|nr:TIGR02266 family protein [Deltaproteobacteria bacterium]OEU46102.1 MAG: hypothetical protein BBJ60_12120 [Desulfobacterales bacterium S7086C20]
MKEHRESPRYEVVLKVRYETEKALRDAVIHNLSSGGLYLTTQNPLAVGYEFDLEIELPSKAEWIKGKCSVVWVNEIDTKDYPRGMGVAFLEMPQKYWELIDGYSDDEQGRISNGQ